MTDRLGICVPVLLAEPMAPPVEEVVAAVDAAGDAGFDGSAFWGYHLDALVEHLGGWEATTAWLDARNLRVRAVEAAFAWPAGSEDAVRAEAEHLAEVARRSGAGVVAAVCMDAELPDEDLARRNLAIVVEAAAAARAVVAVEFLPWSGIPDLATAWRLVEPLGPRAGILLDAWHWHRQPGGPDHDLLASIPGERIPYVQICDAGAAPADDVLGEAMSARLLPGEGVVDVAAMLATLARTGAEPFVAAEPFNPARLAGDGVDGYARAILEAWRTCR